MNILADFMSALTAIGPAGMLLGLFAVVFLDSIVIPIGPELLAIAVFATNIDPFWALLIVGTVALAQVAGSTLLYLIGRHPTIMPGFLKKVMNRYRSGLLIRDERMVLLNCFVPVLPFLGAFVAVAKWNYRRSMSYVVVGGAIKYSLFLGMSSTFHQLFEEGIAQRVSLMAVLALLVVSGLYAYSKRKNFVGGSKG